MASDLFKSHLEWIGVDWAFVLEIVFLVGLVVFLVLFILCCCRSRDLEKRLRDTQKSFVASKDINDESFNRLTSEGEILRNELLVARDAENNLKSETQQLRNMVVSNEQALLLYSAASQKLRILGSEALVESDVLSTGFSHECDRSLLVELWVADPVSGRPVRWSDSRMSFIGEMWLPSPESIQIAANKSGDNDYLRSETLRFISKVRNSRDDPLKRVGIQNELYAKLCGAVDREVREQASKFLDEVPFSLQKAEASDLMFDGRDLISADIQLRLKTSTGSGNSPGRPSQPFHTSQQVTSALEVQVRSVQGIATTLNEPIPDPVGKLSLLKNKLPPNKSKSDVNKNTEITINKQNLPECESVNAVETGNRQQNVVFGEDVNNNLNNKSSRSNNNMNRKLTKEENSQTSSNLKPSAYGRNWSNNQNKTASNVSTPNHLQPNVDHSTEDEVNSVVENGQNFLRVSATTTAREIPTVSQSVVLTVLIWEKRRVNSVRILDGSVAQPKAALEDSPRVANAYRSGNSFGGDFVDSPGSQLASHTESSLIWELLSQSEPSVVSAHGVAQTNLNAFIHLRKMVYEPNDFALSPLMPELVTMRKAFDPSPRQKESMFSLQRENTQLQRELDALRGLARDRQTAIDNKALEIRKLETEVVSLRSTLNAKHLNDKSLSGAGYGIQPEFSTSSPSPPAITALKPSSAGFNSLSGSIGNNFASMPITQNTQLAETGPNNSSLWSSMCVKHQGILARDNIAEVKCVLSFSSDQTDGSRCAIELRIQAVTNASGNPGARFSKVEFECVNHERGALLLALLPMTTSRGPPLQFISVIHAEMVAPFFEPPTCDARIELADGTFHNLTFKLPLNAARFLSPAGIILNPLPSVTGSIQNPQNLSNSAPMAPEVWIRDWHDTARFTLSVKLLKIHSNLQAQGEDTIAKTALAGGAIGEITTVQHHLAEGALLGAARWVRRSASGSSGFITSSSSGIPVLLRMWMAGGQLSGLVKLEVKSLDADLAMSVCNGLAELLGEEVHMQNGNQSGSMMQSNTSNFGDKNKLFKVENGNFQRDIYSR